MKSKTLRMTITIDHARKATLMPSDYQLQQWIRKVLEAYYPKAVLTIRLVDTIESATLNQEYRQKPGPTNILTFRFDPPPGMTSNILGDIVLCPTLIAQEIPIQPPPLHLVEARWAHLLIHGCLHLIGHHHDDDIAADNMEKLEIEHLTKLGYPNPYE